MSKKSQIRWRESDLQELQRVINNFNAKLYRISKNRPEDMQFMPERLTKTQALKDITTRADYNKFLASAKRFSSQRGSEELVTLKNERHKVTQWHVDEQKRRERAENIRRAKLKKKIEAQEVTIAGKGTGVKRAAMGKIKEHAVDPIHKDLNKMTMKEFDEAWKLYEKRDRESFQAAKKELALRNYIKAMIKEGFSDSTIQLLNAVDVNTFDIKLDTDEAATFDFIYSPEELRAKESALKELWSKEAIVLQENVTGTVIDDQAYYVTAEGEINPIKDNQILIGNTLYKNVNQIDLDEIEREIENEMLTYGRL